MDTKLRQKSEFQDRLKRIASGGPNTTGQVYCGVSEEITNAAKPATQSSVQRMSFLMLVLSFFMGAGAMLTGRFGAFRYFMGDADGLTKTFGQLGGFIAVNMGDLVIAACLAIIFMYLFKLRGHWRGTALVVGLVSMMLGEVQLIVRAPDMFSVLYSADFVEQVLSEQHAGVQNQPDPIG